MVGTDGIVRFDRSGMMRLVAGAPATARSDSVGERSGAARVCVTFGP